MWEQKSFQPNTAGALYLVPTPIGNLEDMTIRAIRILKEADVIAAEDTRVTRKLCNYFEITTPVTSYHEHNKEKSGNRLLDDLKSGKTVALVSDAGMPSISDPGYELVCLALEHRFPVIPLPGANAAVTALIASGLPPQPFYFYGFLPRQKKEKKEVALELKKIQATMVFYESPHRLKETIFFLRDSLGDRQVVISRELTKKFEEFIRGSLIDVSEWIMEKEIRGECCIIVEGASEEELVKEEQWWETFSITEHIEYYINDKDMSSKEAIKQVALDRKLPKREVYDVYHIQ
ncbi:16S rRNA (cytidine(1402)-2'-O)-methyltransferase [Bacillus salitolerans]|uniref:Ribosomal RNA small subunit methyltransferase I n=1 Tax=Bacillus salitolerans TaxID=1437434 RepID=A0ABW4LRY0_9BACI